MLLVVSVFAQRDQLPGEITWGNEIREPANSYLSDILGVDDDGFYTLRQKARATASGETPQQIYIEYFNRDMKLKKAQEISLKHKKKRRDLEKVLYLNGNLFLLTSFNNQAHKANYLFVQEIKKKSLTLSTKLRKIGEAPAKDKYREGKFNFDISRDSSKVLIYSGLPYKKKEAEKFSLQVFDNNFDELWKKNITLPYNDSQFALERYIVDNDGNVYLLGVLFEDKVRYRRNGKPTYKYVILAYTNDGEEKQKYTIDLGEKFITDLTFKVGDDGHLVCTGFFSDRGTTSVKGTYFFKLNPETKEVYNQNLKEFGFDFLTEYHTGGGKRRAARAERDGNTRRQAELYQYSLDELILRSDGGALLIAEQFFIERFDNFNNRFAGVNTFNNRFNRFDNRITYEYNYNDIIVVNIRPNGEIQWVARVPKRQETTDDGGYYSSYAHAVVRDRIFIVYNDNGRNFGREDNRRYRFTGSSNSIITVAEIRKDGSVEIHPLANNRDERFILRPKVSQQIGRREMAIFGEKGKRFRFGSIDFK